jgi:formylglycine-generating enzyme required for sulfatase activity
VAAQFSAGYSVNPFRVESERALTLGGETAETPNNRDATGTNPSWTDDFNSDQPRTLPAEFPKGYKAFYCMRREITQQQYVDFLNTLSYAEQCQRSGRQVDAPPGTRGVRQTHEDVAVGRNGIKIAASGMAGGHESVVIRRESFVASGTIVKPGKPAVYAADAPHVACNFITHIDGSAYASWAGLRPMTELEFEKACRGPLKPVPNEYAWGTAAIAGMDSKNGAYKLQDPGKPDETIVWEGDDGPDATHGNAALWRIRVESKVEFAGPLRVGIFATPTSDRVSSGASYWGVLDLSGNVAERAMSVGIPAGRAFAGTHGDGGASPWKDAGFGVRGGGYPHGGRNLLPTRFRTSDRYYGAWPHHDGRAYATGFRCVRTAPVAKSE